MAKQLTGGWQLLAVSPCARHCEELHCSIDKHTRQRESMSSHKMMLPIRTVQSATALRLCCGKTSSGLLDMQSYTERRGQRGIQPFAFRHKTTGCVTNCKRARIRPRVSREGTDFRVGMLCVCEYHYSKHDSSGGHFDVGASLKQGGSRRAQEKG